MVLFVNVYICGPFQLLICQFQTMSNSSSRMSFLGFESVENQDLAPTGVPGPTGSSFRFGMFHLRLWSNASFDAANAEENLFA